MLQDHTYHAERSRFDLMLMKYAEGLGCRILAGAQVRQVVFEGEKATGVLVDAGGNDLHVPADLVVDASGRAALLGHQLEMRRSDRELDQFALHGWFAGVDRGKHRTSVLAEMRQFVEEVERSKDHPLRAQLVDR